MLLVENISVLGFNLSLMLMFEYTHQVGQFGRRMQLSVGRVRGEHRPVAGVRLARDSLCLCRNTH